MALTLTTGNTFAAGDVVTATKLNNVTNAATYTGSLEVAKGGTGSTTAADARTALSVPEASTVMLKANNLSDLANAATARTNLGVSATAATLLVANNLSDLASAATARANLGLADLLIKNTSQLDNATTTYQDIPGLTTSLVSGTTYTIETFVPYSTSGNSGAKFCLAGTATGSSVSGSGTLYHLSGLQVSLITSLSASLVSSPGYTITAGMFHASFTVVCNGSGTVKWQFAEQSAVGTASALLGAWMRVTSY